MLHGSSDCSPFLKCAGPSCLLYGTDCPANVWHQHYGVVLFNHFPRRGCYKLPGPPSNGRFWWCQLLLCHPCLLHYRYLRQKITVAVHNNFPIWPRLCLSLALPSTFQGTILHIWVSLSCSSSCLPRSILLVKDQDLPRTR